MINKVSTRCFGCHDFMPAVNMCRIYDYECPWKTEPKENLLRFVSRSRFGTCSFRLDLRGISCYLAKSEQNRILYEIRQSDDPERIYQQWLDYVEWLSAHEERQAGIQEQARIKWLRERLITEIRRYDQ